MKIALRRLTAREHVLAASVLVFALTMIAADIALPDAARLRSAGHLTTASILSVLPVFALALSRQHCLRSCHVLAIIHPMPSLGSWEDCPCWCGMFSSGSCFVDSKRQLNGLVANQSRQPTLGERPRAFPTPLARCGCAHRWP